MERRTFRAMATDIELLVDVPASVGTDLALAGAEREIARLEGLLSRFREDSELTALNRAGTLHAGPDLVRVTQLAVEARARTHGRFDPTIHDAVVAAGYDRSFEDVQARVAPALAPVRCGGGITVYPETGVIELEAGVRLDLGGIAKGYSVDRACDLLSGAGPCLVDAGGDMAIRGGRWPVGVETHEGVVTLELSAGAVATSGVDRRHWLTAAGEAHHLIDPRVGRPAESDLLRVTVIADSATEAEVLAKSLFFAGAELGAVEADELGAPAVLVTTDGRTVFAGGLQ